MGTTMAVVLMAGLSACSTPSSRIAKNQALFNSFPLNVQERIRVGEIDVGFNAEMVNIALGEPDRKFIRTSDQGQRTIWSYVEYDIRTERQLVKARVRVRDSNGSYSTATDNVWVDVQSKTEYDKKRVEFLNGRVTAFEIVHR